MTFLEVYLFKTPFSRLLTPGDVTMHRGSCVADVANSGPSVAEDDAADFQNVYAQLMLARSQLSKKQH